MSEMVNLAAIRINGGTQPRGNIDFDMVKDYAEQMEAGATFPPITLYFDGKDYWLADGFHRWHAVRRLNRKEIAADVQQGTQRDAILFSTSANATHGLRRTRADMQRAIDILLRDAEWRQWSDREIANRVGCDHKTVGARRRSMYPSTGEIPQSERIGADGRRINTGNIGKKADQHEKLDPDKMYIANTKTKEIYTQPFVRGAEHSTAYHDLAHRLWKTLWKRFPNVGYTAHDFLLRSGETILRGPMAQYSFASMPELDRDDPKEKAADQDEPISPDAATFIREKWYVSDDKPSHRWIYDKAFDSQIEANRAMVRLGDGNYSSVTGGIAKQLVDQGGYFVAGWPELEDEDGDPEPQEPEKPANPFAGAKWWNPDKWYVLDSTNGQLWVQPLDTQADAVAKAKKSGLYAGPIRGDVLAARTANPASEMSELEQVDPDAEEETNPVPPEDISPRANHMIGMIKQIAIDSGDMAALAELEAAYPTVQTAPVRYEGNNAFPADYVRSGGMSSGQIAAITSSDSEEWYTPDHIVQLVLKVLGEIDLDPASNSRETPNIPAVAHLTREEDGLKQAWGEEGDDPIKVFVNPPYGDEIPQWIDKVVEEYEAGRVEEAILLLPSRTDTAWMRKLAKYPRCYIWGRLKFKKPDGSEAGNALFPSVVVYMGKFRKDFAKVFGEIGDVFEKFRG